MEEGLKVKDIMTKDVVTLDVNTPISEAANLLITRNFTGAPVLQDGSMVGIVTEADFFARGEAVHLPTFLQLFSQVQVFKRDEKRFKEEFQKFLSTKVKDIMTKDVVTVDADMAVEELASLFIAKRLNPLPVVKNGKMVGIVSRSDIVKIFKL